MTSISLKMEDDLNFFENGRRPYFFYFFIQKKDDLNIFKNGRRPQKINHLHSTAHTSRQPDEQNKLK